MGIGAVERCLENFFEKVGRAVGTHPIKSLVGSIIFTIACGGGFAFLTTESRPEKQWVPAGSLALEHNDYVSNTWPGNARFNFFSATCADVDEANCNIMDPKYIQRFHEINEAVKDIVIDGDQLVKDLDEDHKRSEGDNRPWTIYAGNWSFSGDPQSVNGSVVFNGRKCFSFGPFCAQSSLLDVFRGDDYVISNLNSTQVKLAVNSWENQETMCPLTLATSDSPCYNSNCQKYKTQQERQDCRVAATSYCQTKCPTMTMMVNGEEVTIPVDMATCQDRGCIQLGSLSSISTTTASGMLNTDPGEAPESAFEFQPTKIKTMVGGLVSDSTWEYAGGKHIAGFWALNKQELYCPTAGVNDPVADEWERRALCLMGIDADSRAKPKLDCQEDGILKFSGLFQRSLGDEFGNAIRGDISKLTASYGVIIVYCAFMLGKCDAVHSGAAMAFVAVGIVGLTIASTLGLMGYFQVPNGNLNNNLYFLLLGLGVDDAFVLTSEYLTHKRNSQAELSVPELIARTARTGGISVLITSATDALAFLVGATTVLPALSWFCTYAGVSIVLCYTFQLTVFLPCLALNAKRTQASRLDCCCCFKVKERELEDPQGCCCCCLPQKAFKGGLIKKGLRTFTEQTTKPLGQALTFLLFAILTGVGIFGTTQIYKDFKLEWFIPDSSYVNTFFTINSENFATGTPITVNFPGDSFEMQSNLREVYGYLNSTSLINPDVAVDSWYQEFMDWATEPNQVATANDSFSPSRSGATAVFTDRNQFYTALHLWYRTNVGARYRNSLRWADKDCEVESSMDHVPAGCTPTEGLLATRFNAELSLAATNRGTDRFDTMTSMRSEVDRLYTGAFPYSFDFLYWEEVGIIDEELMKNLAICGAVILVVIFALVPNPRIAIWVVLCVCLSIVDTLGYMYFWDVTISGVSTIYVLICVGLAVDYAAHIAHMFKESTGSARERAINSVDRIGVCTFNAVLSTLLAVVVVGFSDSYVFRIFFKVLFLVVTIAGAHGLWLLPSILSLVGGSKPAPEQEGPRAMETEPSGGRPKPRPDAAEVAAEARGGSDIPRVHSDETGMISPSMSSTVLGARPPGRKYGAAQADGAVFRRTVWSRIRAWSLKVPSGRRRGRSRTIFSLGGRVPPRSSRWSDHRSGLESLQRVAARRDRAPSFQVAVKHAKKMKMKKEICSAEDEVKLAEMESELEALTNFVWDIPGNVKDLMETVTGKQEDEYDSLSQNGCGGATSWTDRLSNALKVTVQGFVTTAASDVAKKATKSVASLIPYAGAVLSAAIELFWPSSDSSYDIWELIVGQVQDLIDETILKKELNSRHADLWAIKRDLTLFTKSSTNTEQSNFLSIALAKVEDVMAHLTTSSNHVQYIPLSVAAATLHCIILRLRVDVGMELYGNYDPAWKAALQGAVAYYQTYFNYAYDEWYQWRREQLTTYYDGTTTGQSHRRRQCKAKLSDSHTGNSYQVEVNDWNKDYCEVVTQWQYNRTVREYAREIVTALQNVMQLQRYIPGMESAEIQVIPAIEYVTLGPFAPYTQFIDYVTYRVRNSEIASTRPTVCGPGDITKITVRSGSFVDKIQINYEDGQECAQGGSGGDAREIDLSNKYVQGISKMCFDDYQMTHMKMTLSDGSESSFGSGSCSVSSDGTVTGDQSYRLVGASIIGSSRVIHVEPMYRFIGLPVSSTSNPSSFNSDTMTSGEILYANDVLQSADGTYTFRVQEDANLVVYDSSQRPIWASKDVAPNDCSDPSTLQLRLQTNDGNLVLYCGDAPLWASKTVASSSICRVLAMQNDGQLAMYNVGNQVGVWSSLGSIPIGFGPFQLTNPDSLAMGQRLVRNFYGTDKSFEFLIEDGQPVVKQWQQTTTVWSAGSSCSTTSEAHLTLQEDGNLVLICDKTETNSRPWATNTEDPSLKKLSGMNKLILDADGALRLINKRGATTWTSAGEEYRYFP
ncbi:Patched domain-containing protein 3 (RND-type protein RNDEu-3) [Durusdinium trenchii]|uniref:Patched domain-containing protein 3 (RND-type protein RNDEu-3) n=1 Tax=Durusdinium trenchii TaxID=1381693 RepID=A0ABP0L1C4_9DINO